MTVRQFIDSLTLVSDIVKDDLREGWKDELDDELTEEHLDWMWERTKEIIFEEFEEEFE